MKRQNIIAKIINDAYDRFSKRTTVRIGGLNNKAEQPRYRNGQWRPTKKVKTVSRAGTVKTVTYYGDWHK